MRFKLLILLFIPGYLFGQETVSNLEIYLSGMPDDIAFYLNENKLNIDTCLSKNEKLHFKYRKNLSKPTGLIVLSKDRRQGYIIWIERDSTKFEGVYGNSSPLNASNSKTQRVFREYMLLTTPLNDSLSSATRKFHTLRIEGDPDSTTFKNKIGKLSSLLKSVNMKFIKDNPNSVVSTQTLFYEASHKRFTNEEIISSFKLLSDEQQNSDIGQSVLRSVLIYQHRRIGDTAPNFSIGDSDGKTVTLSDYIGKNVILIFWASWCTPCIKELPEIKQLYETLEDKNNVVFIAVSLDEKKDSWLEAIKKYAIPFVNVSDFKGWMSDPALIYGVSGIPDNFLIDVNGKLSARERGFKAIKMKLLELNK